MTVICQPSRTIRAAKTSTALADKVRNLFVTGSSWEDVDADQAAAADRRDAADVVVK
jgi:hypothetical protein